MSIPWRVPFCFNQSPAFASSTGHVRNDPFGGASFAIFGCLAKESYTMSHSGGLWTLGLIRFFLHRGFGKGRTAGNLKKHEKNGMMIRMFVFCCCKL